MGKERLSDLWETEATQEFTEPDIDSWSQFLICEMAYYYLT